MTEPSDESEADTIRSLRAEIKRLREEVQTLRDEVNRFVNRLICAAVR